MPMDTPFRQFKKTDIQWAVDRNKERIQATTRLALNYLSDPQKKERRAEGYCVCCFYRESTIAGQAFTTSFCGCCSKEMTWPTTHQEKLCPDCAKKWSLCRECGSTVDNKEPRSIEVQELKP